jgi:predicted transport protein
MSDIKLFRISGSKVAELAGRTPGLEKTLHILIEKNLEAMLGVKFLASEYATGKTHRGRIDSLGLDENHSPVIIEYKRAAHENVINQGLFYLDWLLDHRAEFQLLVQRKLGQKQAEAIDWAGTRLVCIASDFTKYDEHAVKQMGRNIELLRYRLFGDEFISLDLVYRTGVDSGSGRRPTGKTRGTDKPAAKWLKDMSPALRALYDELHANILALGDDVDVKKLKFYVAFRRIRNFVCIAFKKDVLMLYVKLDPKTVRMEAGFSRDVSSIGHWGTGDVELKVGNQDDLLKALPLVRRSYDES